MPYPSLRDSLRSVGLTLRRCLAVGLPAASMLLAAYAAAPAAQGASRSTPDPSPNRGPQSIQEELRLAGDYMAGRGVAKDAAQAAYWYKKAADQGDPAAQNQLGYLYVWGIGVDQDAAQAAKWFTRASSQGWEPAKANLAVLYLRGLGVRRDTSLAFDLLNQLAAKKNARAEDYLGAMYFSGYGVEQNRATAEKWFRLAAKGHNPEGEYAMGALYSDTPDHEHNYRKAARFLRESARAGFVPAMSSLGILLVNHPEIPRKGADEPIVMLTRAAQAGTWESSASLGVLARAGHGRNRDLAEAFRWFTIAIRQGGSEADERMHRDLVRCRQALSADQQNEEEQAANAWLTQHPHADLFVFDNPVHSQFPTAEILAIEQRGME